MASASNRGQGGIQQLLAAEQDAQHIVNAARNGDFLFLIFACQCCMSCVYQSMRVFSCDLPAVSL